MDMNKFILKEAKKRGADDVVVDTINTQINQIRFYNNKISISKSWDTKKINIFIVKDKVPISNSIEVGSKKDIERTIKRMLKMTKLIRPNKDWGGIAEGKFKYKKIPSTYDKRILDIESRAVDFVEAAINSSESKRAAGVLYTYVSDRHLTTSGGVDVKTDKGTSIELSIRAFNEKDESGHAVSCARTLRDFDPESAGKKAGRIAKDAKNPEKGKPGKFDIIFDPLAFANILDYFAWFSSAFWVDSGFSFLYGKLNKKVASDIVTIYNDGRVKGGFGSREFDDEGVPTMRSDIIKDGILKNYLHNTSTAKKYNTKTNACAGLIVPTAQNIILEPGKFSKENLFSNVKNALYITNVWYTRFQNYQKGDFSTIPRDGIFLIRNGEIVKSLKGIRISSNMEYILKNIEAISNSPEWIHWWEVNTPVYTPYVLVRGVQITRPEM